jgi:hypothetical protein
MIPKRTLQWVTVVLAVAFLSSACRVSEVKPAGSWELIKQGMYESVDWKLFSTEPNGGGTCLNLETEAEIELSKDLGDDLYQGRVPACLFTPRQGSSSQYIRAVQSMQYGSRERGQANYGFLIGLVDPSVKSVTVNFEGSEELVVDTSDGFVVVLYDASTLPRKIALEVDNRVIECSLKQTNPPAEVSC